MQFRSLHYLEMTKFQPLVIVPVLLGTNPHVLKGGRVGPRSFWTRRRRGLTTAAKIGTPSHK
jgi:hypothetical protein